MFMLKLPASEQSELLIIMTVFKNYLYSIVWLLRPLYIQTGSPLRPLYIQTGPSLRLLYISTSPPLRLLYIQTGPPLRLLYIQTGPPLRLLYIQTSPPLRLLYIQTGPPLRPLNIQTGPPLRPLYIQTGPPLRPLFVCSKGGLKCRTSLLQEMSHLFINTKSRMIKQAGKTNLTWTFVYVVPKDEVFFQINDLPFPSPFTPLLFFKNFELLIKPNLFVCLCGCFSSSNSNWTHASTISHSSYGTTTFRNTINNSTTSTSSPSDRWTHSSPLDRPPDSNKQFRNRQVGMRKWE